jgi:hypothetical protein
MGTIAMGFYSSGFISMPVTVYPHRTGGPHTPQEADSIQRQIAATDAAIDKLVYELYDLTIVEGKSK